MMNRFLQVSVLCVLLEIIDGTKFIREYTGPDWSDKLLDANDQFSRIYSEKLRNTVSLIISEVIDSAVVILMKKSRFAQKGKRKLKDHCHFSLTFIGLAHNKCNLK